MINAMWLTIITMTTVGYGDFYPQTHLGRFVGVVACLIGMILVSLVVISLTSLIEFNADEGRVKSMCAHFIGLLDPEENSYQRCGACSGS